MRTYTVNQGMILTPVGQAWLRSLLSNIGQFPPLTLELGTFEWGNAVYQRVQRPILSIPANAGSILLDRLTERYTEAGIVNQAGQTLAVTTLDVSQNNAPGLFELLRLRVLVHTGTTRRDQKTPAVKFANSTCRLVAGVMDCDQAAAAGGYVPLNLIPDPELATEAPPGWVPPGQKTATAASDDPDLPVPALLSPTDSIGVNVGIGSRWGMRVHAGWRLPRSRMWMGIEPGIYLHIMKTTRFYHA